jgi:hypothetical protein
MSLYQLRRLYSGGLWSAWAFVLRPPCVSRQLRNGMSISTLLHSETNATHYIIRSPIVNLQLALKVPCRNALVRRADHMNREEPLIERHVRVVEYRPGRNRILVAAINALVQMACFARLASGVKAHNPSRTATCSDATEAVRPANLLKMSDAEFFGIELLERLEKRDGFPECFRLVASRSCGFHASLGRLICGS